MVEEEQDWSYNEFFYQEQGKIDNVLASMEQCQIHTESMMDILGTFEVKLTALEKQMMPIHQATQKLTNAQKNIDASLVEVEQVIVHYNVASEAEAVVEMRNVTSDWESYVSWVGRVKAAKDFFEENIKFRDADKYLRKLNGFLRKGMTDCVKEFERLMQQHGAPIKRLEWPLPEGFTLIPSQFEKRLMNLAWTMSENQKLDFLELLKKERSETFKNNIRKSLTHEAKGDSKIAKQQGPYQKGTSVLSFQLRFFLALLEKEHQLFHKILKKVDKKKLGDEVKQSAWAELVDRPLDFYLNKRDGIDKKEKDANKVLILLDMVNDINDVTPKFQKLLKAIQADKIHDMLRLTLAAAKKAFFDFKDSILEARTRSKQAMVDGTISPLSIETLNFLKRLYEYKDTIDGISKAALVEEGTEEQPGTSTIYAITRMILTALKQTLTAKAKAFRSPALSKIFLLNNYYYVRRTVSKSNLEVGKDFNQTFDTLIVEARSSYLQYTWVKLLDILDTKDLAAQLPRPKEGQITERKGLSQNVRKKIKTRFQNFNAAFQKIYSEQSQYSVPDSDLRSSLRSENVELLLERYKEFLQLFRHVEFTTQPDKYIKYDALSLETCLDKFFDEEA
eukprot:gb/GEZN01004519.1/.p1 GENE.gb/GEZN01004519.1/~~gb/GEZN01004519.1/.p1  ORF type:complete len:619 (-),score=134.34 gb/GEZN01004519.1/:18-1874(-)